MKKHGFIWWLFIGWWWRPITWPFRLLARLIRLGRAYSDYTRAGVQDKPAADQETHKVAGVSFRQDALRALGKKNPDFKKTKQQLQAEGLTDTWIYEYTFAPEKVELIPEPELPDHPNAIKVVVDGQHIGYIKSGSSAHVHKLIDADRIQQLACFIGGGKSKTVTLDEDGERYIVETNEIGFYARLTVVTKPE